MSDLNKLTAADITAILSNARERGGTEKTLREFNASGEMYAVLNSMPRYAGKNKEQLSAIKNQLTMKAKALDLGNIRLVKSDDNFLIVNTDLLGESEEGSE